MCDQRVSDRPRPSSRHEHPQTGTKRKRQDEESRTKRRALHFFDFPLWNFRAPVNNLLLLLPRPPSLFSFPSSPSPFLKTEWAAAIFSAPPRIARQIRALPHEVVESPGHSQPPDQSVPRAYRARVPMACILMADESARTVPPAHYGTTFARTSGSGRQSTASPTNAGMWSGAILSQKEQTGTPVRTQKIKEKKKQTGDTQTPNIEYKSKTKT